MYIYEISKFGLETDTNMIHDPTSAMQLNVEKLKQKTAFSS